MSDRYLVALLIVLGVAAGNPCLAVPMNQGTSSTTPGPSILPPAPPPEIEVTGPLSPAAQQALKTIAAGNYDDGIKQAREAATAAGDGPEAAPAYELLGIAQYLKGDTQAAVETLKHAIELNPKQGSALTRLGSIALADNDLTTAKSWFDRALLVNPKDRLARARLAAVLERQGDITGAISAYQEAIADLPANQIGARIDLANLYNQQRRYADTVRLLAMVDPNSTDRAALIALGIADVETGAADAGLRLLMRARQLDLSDPVAALALGIAQRETGELADSVATLQQAAAIQPPRADAYYQLGLSYLALSKYDDARQALAHAKDLDPDASAIIQGLGESLLLGGKPTEAIAVLHGLAYRNTGRLSDFVSLATAYQLSGNLAAAETTYRDAVARFPTNAAAYWRLGAMLALERRYADALEALNKAEQMTPNDPRVLRDISLVLLREGKIPESLKEAQRLVALDPKSIDSRFYLAGLYQDSGDTGHAMELYRAILADNPDYVYALNNLAELLTDRGNAAEALPMARRAVTLMPNSAVVADTLGWTLLKAGKNPEALSELKRAAELAPTNAETLYRLAVAQDATGNPAMARATAAKALAISTDFKDATAAKALAGQPPG